MTASYSHQHVPEQSISGFEGNVYARDIYSPVANGGTHAQKVCVNKSVDIRTKENKEGKKCR